MKALFLFIIFAVNMVARAQDVAAVGKLDDPEALARVTAMNLGAVSAMLSKNQRDVETLIAGRIDAIVARERTAAAAQNLAKRELSVYKNTRSELLGNNFQAMIDAGNSAAAETIEVTALEADLRAKMKSSTSIPELSTEKLDAAAKKLAALADETTSAERAKQAIKFFKDTKDAVKKLEEEAEAAKKEAESAPLTGEKKST